MCVDTDFSKPLEIDSHLAFSSRVIQSPLHGVMSRYFVSGANELGLVREWITPFISVSAGAVPSLSALRRVLVPYRNAYPLVVQLSGHDADSLAETSLRLAELDVSGVNLNFACPSPTVLSAGNGGAILRDLSLLERITRECVNRAGRHISISLKLRVGFDAYMEDLPCFAADSGVGFVICHYRTVVENYDVIHDGLPRLKKFVEAAGRVKVIGNGDILSLDDAVRMRESSLCCGVALGRAMLSDPFLAERIRGGVSRPPLRSEKLRFLARILENGLSGRGVDREKMRKLPPPGGLLECVRMCFGVESMEFEFAKTASLDALLEYFTKDELNDEKN